MTGRDDASVIGADVLGVIVERLAPWRSTSDDALAAIVVVIGACLGETSDGDRPGWLFDDSADRELAALICAECPVSDACLELELRLFGAARLGMWGSLGEDGRRALHPVWAQGRPDVADSGRRGDRR